MRISVLSIELVEIKTDGNYFLDYFKTFFSNTVYVTECQGTMRFNPLTPNDPYRSSTAPLTSKVAFHVFIQQI